MKTLQIHAYQPSVRDILGPGLRAVVWVQGCDRHCPGCILPESWDPNGGRSISPNLLAEELFSDSNIEGITVSGGEPFDQPRVVGTLLRLARKNNLNTLIYTGYTIEELLEKNDRNIDTLLSLCDVLIDGAYCEELEPGCLRGSINQRILCMTDKIPMTRLKNSSFTDIEITMDATDNLMLVGIPPRDFLQSFENKMTAKGIFVETTSTARLVRYE